MLRGMENTFEKKETPELKFDEYHKKGKELLGELYNERAFDQIMGSFLHDTTGFLEELNTLEKKLNSVEDEKEKDQIRKEWMARNNILGEIFDVADDEE